MFSVVIKTVVFSEMIQKATCGSITCHSSKRPKARSLTPKCNDLDSVLNMAQEEK